MRVLRAGLFAGLFFMAAPTLSAVAANGYTTGNVNERAGPGTQYPVITTIPAGSPVTIFGCLSGYSWCDVAWRGTRGWVAANYLQGIYQARRVPLSGYGARIGVPFVAFHFGPYWDTHYRGRSWYNQHRHSWGTSRPPSYRSPRARIEVPSRPSYRGPGGSNVPEYGIPPRIRSGPAWQDRAPVRPRPPQANRNRPGGDARPGNRRPGQKESRSRGNDNRQTFCERMRQGNPDLRCRNNRRR